MKIDSAYILTGGGSRRFGSPKCIAEINGKTLLEIVSENLGVVFPRVYQVGKQSYGPLPFVPDISGLQNSLTGIVTALRHCTGHWVFIIACDMPLVDDKVINAMIRELDDRHNLIIPEVDGYLQYTCAFYSKRMLPELEKYLASGEFALHQIVRDVPFKTVAFSTTEKFVNINRAADLDNIQSN